MLHALQQAMISYYGQDIKRIQHFLKVHSFARFIGEAEHLSEEEQLILEAAALVHDIGIKLAEEQYHRCDGPLQEKLGPPEAEKMMREIGFSREIIDRVCYLVGHHHTYHDIDGKDYQILVEADFLVNICEKDEIGFSLDNVYERIFQTESGKFLFRTMFWASK